jgi:hypothetical protein
MKRNPDFGQKDFEIFTTQVFLGSITNSLQSIAASFARLRVDSSERQVIVARFEVVAFLLRQLGRQARYDC